MNKEDQVLNRALVRQARPPAQGTSATESGAGRIGSGSSRSTTVIDDGGRVRRLWTPGDNWESGAFYFGASD